MQGEVSEWLKEHAWKVCIRQRIEGSNPSLTATNSETRIARCGFFYGRYLGCSGQYCKEKHPHGGCYFLYISSGF